VATLVVYAPRSAISSNGTYPLQKSTDFFMSALRFAGRIRQSATRKIVSGLKPISWKCLPLLPRDIEIRKNYFVEFMENFLAVFRGCRVPAFVSLSLSRQIAGAV